MTPQDILNASPDIDRNHPVMRMGEVIVPLFGGPVALHVIGPKDDLVVTEEMAADLTALLAVSPEQMGLLEALLSENCTRTCEEMDYDIIDVELVPGQDDLTTCRRAFGMNDDGTIPPGLVAGWVSFIGLDIPNGAYMRFNPPWEEEHGVLVRLDGGVFTEFRLEYYGPNTGAFRLPMPA